MNDVAIYWQSRFGVVERQTGPDKNGWMTVRCLQANDAIRELMVAEMAPLTTAQALDRLGDDATLVAN